MSSIRKCAGKAAGISMPVLRRDGRLRAGSIFRKKGIYRANLNCRVHDKT